MKKNKQKKNKDTKEGYCNICKQYSQLTRDHIPPKGCVEPTSLDLITLKQYLTKSNEKPTISQNGLWRLSICKNCNNSLLGRNYDPKLIEFSNQVANLLKGQEVGLCLPEKIKLNVNLQPLIRAVIGHVLASSKLTPGQPPPPGLLPDALRDYFLNTSSAISDKIEIYYWIYPSKQQRVMNGFCIVSAIREKEIMCTSLLKFFPLAFWIVWDRPPSFEINCQKISNEKLSGLDENCEIVISLRNFPPLNYPEVIDLDKYLVMYNNELTVFAQPRNSKGFGQAK